MSASGAPHAKLHPDYPWTHHDEQRAGQGPNGKDQRHEYLAAKFEQLPNSIRNGFRDIQSNEDPRAKVDLWLRQLRHHGWTLPEAIEWARYSPRGFGILEDFTARLFNETWKQFDEEEAERAGRKAAEAALAKTLFDPWQEIKPPEWPNGILSQHAETTLAQVALRDGTDYGAQCLAYITAASGAAPKNARFSPYLNNSWSVPPIIWTLLIADSAQRKTAIMQTAFEPLRRVHGSRWSDHMRQMEEWNAREGENQRGPKPKSPHSYLVNDVTAEALQRILANSDRGSCLVMDELARFLDFGRYTGGGANRGASERAFYLEAYEGGSYTVHRVGRGDLFILVNALTIFGCIQPSRLAEFTGLETDGLLQRFTPYLPTRAAFGQSSIDVQKEEKRLRDAIESLATFSTALQYSTTPEGAELIKSTERDGIDFAQITDFGPGWQGFCGKLHGLHARISLILHLLSGNHAETISTDTVRSAGRLTRHLLRHARAFYDSVPNSNLTKLRDIGGWLLTKAKPRVLASDLTTSVKACRGLGTKEVGALIDPFVSGGWLTPESPFPNNRAWELNLDIRSAFSDRADAEQQRRDDIRARIGRIDEL